MEKNFKFLVVAGGVLGLIAAFLPMVSFGDQSISLWSVRAGAAAEVYITMGGFLIAAIAGIMGIVKGKMNRALGGVALVGAALAMFKVREMFSGAIGGKLLFIGAVVALLGSIAVLAKPEE